MGKPVEDLRRSMAEAVTEIDRAFPVPCQLLFDDEPIDTILYGSGHGAGTPVSIYAQARSAIERIEEAAQKADPRDALVLIARLVEADHPMPEAACVRLAVVLKNIEIDGQRLYAAYPQPSRSDCPVELTRAVEWIRKKVDPSADREVLLAVEDLEYGVGLRAASAAVVAAWAVELMPQIARAATDGDLDETLKLAVQLVSAPHSVPQEVLGVVVGKLRGLQQDGRHLISNYPQPPQPQCRPEVTLLLEWLWREAGKCGNEDLILAVGYALHRWYELDRRYSDSREVLQRMIEIDHRREMWADEAICMANHAFTFAFEKNWKHAAEQFERMIEVFRGLGMEIEVANAQANYWLCRVEEEGMQDVATIESQMKRAAILFESRRDTCEFDSHGDWRETKVLLLLAKVEEARGRLDSAVSLVKRCLSIDRKFNSIYLDRNNEYLKQLEERVALRQK